MDTKKSFLKSDLRDGMIVELVNAQLYRVDGAYLESKSHDDIPLALYSDTLEYGVHKDIIDERPEEFAELDIRSIYIIEYNDRTRQYDYDLIYQRD